MADKFTPYGLTALPSAIEDRDPNGIYFIRTVTGFKIVCIADNPSRTPVELDYTSFTETDPTVPSHVKAITTGDINDWNTAYDWGNHALAGYFKFISLLGNESLDNITISGFYQQGTSSNASVANNYPNGATAGMLRHYNHFTYKEQYYSNRENGRTWYRTYYSSWSEWIEFIHTGNLDSQATSLGFIKSADLSGYVPTSRTITAGNGLSGGGTLAANRTITLGTPGAITLSSTNSVGTSSHTHAFEPGGTSAQYIRGDGSLATIPTNHVTTSRTITAGNGLTGGGTLAANRTITLGTPTAIGLSTTNSVTSTSHTHALDQATIVAINQGVTAHGWGNHANAGYVDLISPQHISGPKTFNTLGLKIQGAYHMPQVNGDALIYLLEYPGGRIGLQIIANKDSYHKSMYLDISDLEVEGTDLRVEYLELSEKVEGSRDIEGEAVNYLGWKKVFDIVTSSIILTADTMTTISLEYGNLPVLAWDDGQAFMQGTHWDIVWEIIGPGQAYRKYSLKGTYGKHVLDTTEIRKAPIGGWQLRLAVDIDLTIPENPKLVIW